MGVGLGRMRLGSKAPHPERLAQMDTGDRGICTVFSGPDARVPFSCVVCGCNRHQETVSPAVPILRLGTRCPVHCSSNMPSSHKQGDGWTNLGCTVITY